jgi:hypothetical protein
MAPELVLPWIALTISLIACCVGFYALHRLNSDSDVGELARHVAQLRKANRAEQMRRVREEAVEARAVSAPLGADGKPLPFGPMMSAPKDVKAALRQRVFGHSMRGNGGNHEPV